RGGLPSRPPIKGRCTTMQNPSRRAGFFRAEWLPIRFRGLAVLRGRVTDAEPRCSLGPGRKALRPRSGGKGSQQLPVFPERFSTHTGLSRPGSLSHPRPLAPEELVVVGDVDHPIPVEVEVAAEFR